MKKGKTETLVKEFERHLVENERSRATVEKYIRDVRAYLAFSGGAVSRDFLIGYKDRLRADYKVASANSMLAAINSFLKFIGRGELALKRFRAQRAAFCPEDKDLTREEYAKLVREAKRRKDDKLELIMQTICATGIRVSELSYITREAVERGEATVICKGKTRRIFIVKDLRKRLLSYIGKNRIKRGAIFLTSNKKPISRTHVWRIMKALCQSARVVASKVFPHNLRHLFAKTFYSIEKDISKLADILGHASIDTTRIYITTSAAEHRRKMENMRLVI